MISFTLRGEHTHEGGCKVNLGEKCVSTVRPPTQEFVAYKLAPVNSGRYEIPVVVAKRRLYFDSGFSFEFKFNFVHFWNRRNSRSNWRQWINGSLFESTLTGASTIEITSSN